MSNKSNLSVLAFGEILWDIIDGQKYLGGAPLNFSAHVVKCGGRSAIISAVGKDNLGEKAIQSLATLHVDSSFVQQSQHKPTGTVDVFLTHGQPDYNIHEDVAFDFIALPHLEKIAKGDFNTFYFGSLAQRSKINRYTLQWILDQAVFDHIFYDINLRKNYYSLEIVRYSLQLCTIFKINDDEVRIISELLYQRILQVEEFARNISNDFDIGIVIITAGSSGCYVLSNGKFDNVPALAVTVVDTVGAGDAFSAAFMYQYNKNHNAMEAAQTGNRLGAYVASARGAIPDYTDDIKKYLR